MKAKFINENNFERGANSRQDVINKITGMASYDDIVEELLNPELTEPTEIFINDYFIDTIAGKYGKRFKVDDLKKAANI